MQRNRQTPPLISDQDEDPDRALFRHVTDEDFATRVGKLVRQERRWTESAMAEPEKERATSGPAKAANDT
jgi:hypothetical protein